MKPIKGEELLLALRQGLYLAIRQGKPVAIIRRANGDLAYTEEVMPSDEVVITGVAPPKGFEGKALPFEMSEELRYAAGHIKRAMEIWQTRSAKGDGITTADVMADALFQSDIYRSADADEILRLSRLASEAQSRQHSGIWQAISTMFARR